jgi:hypothetical protein
LTTLFVLFFISISSTKSENIKLLKKKHLFPSNLQFRDGDTNCTRKLLFWLPDNAENWSKIINAPIRYTIIWVAFARAGTIVVGELLDREEGDDDGGEEGEEEEVDDVLLLLMLLLLSGSSSALSLEDPSHTA